MMAVELYALILLVFRALSVFLTGDVIRKQIELRKRPLTDKGAHSLREDMYRLSIAILALNVVPIYVDIKALLHNSERPDVIPTESVIYVFSYAIGTLLLTLFIWRMYRNALR